MRQCLAKAALDQSKPKQHAVPRGCRACGLSSLLATEPCSVFSLGSHGQVDFEQAVRERYPHCRIFVYDHTLNDKQRAAVLAVNGKRRLTFPGLVQLCVRRIPTTACTVARP